MTARKRRPEGWTSENGLAQWRAYDDWYKRAYLAFEPSPVMIADWMRRCGHPIAEGAAFPNPFVADGGRSVYIPASAAIGTLTIFSSEMDLIYTGSQESKMYFGKRVFSWDGMTDKNSPARSGIYIFVLTLPGRSLTGKIALFRR